MFAIRTTLPTLALLAGALAGSANAQTTDDFFPDGSTVFVALPDTQLYAQNYPDIFHSQTQWIAEHIEDLNIAAVFHEGDITNRNTDVQWAVARAAMNRIIGHVPVLMGTGNHDHGPNGNAANRSTKFEQYFPPRSFFGRDDTAVSMTPGQTLNHYRLFEAGGRKWIGIALEWGPRDSVVAWANEVLAEHEDRLAIIVTHAYMHRGSRRIDRLAYGDGQGGPYNYGTSEDPDGTNDGGELWRELVLRHPNVMMVLSGHISGTGRLSSRTPFGNVVHQMLSDYQSEPNGGGGYLRLIGLLPDGQTLQVRSYSPWEDAFLTNADNQFTLSLVTAPGHSGIICRADMNADEQLNVQDLLAYLSAFRARDPAADFAPEGGDGTLNVQDLLAYLSAFRARCD